ncbi:MAG: hypothetical protein FWC56_03565 [Phycisphaerae bacterium]|nr:hypothetical protein [Phycisphaerae bacterium]
MSNLFQSALQSVGYLLSLPERSIRSLAAVAGGTTTLLTETLFPEALRETTFYRVFVGNAQQFMITQIAQVQREAAAMKHEPQESSQASTPDSSSTMPIPSPDTVTADQVDNANQAVVNQADSADQVIADQVGSIGVDSTVEGPEIANIWHTSGKSMPTPDQIDNYVPRKVLGNALEVAGLFAMHVSPLWVFALAGDVAAGTNVFLQRLVDQLKKNGVVPADAQVSGLTDLLGVVEETSRKGATAIDTPPLSREDLSLLAQEMIGQSKQLFEKTTDLLPRMETLWAKMQQVSDRQNISLDALSGILSIDVAGLARKGVGAVKAVGQTSGGLIGEKILDSYAATLEQVSQKGVASYLSNHWSPFFAKIYSHFNPNEKSWTESFLGFGKEDS